MPLLLVATRGGADVAACLIAILFLIHSKKHRHWSWTEQLEMRILAALWCFMMVAAWFTPFDHTASFTVAFIWGRFVLFYAAIRYWLLRTPAALLTLGRMGFAIFVLVAIDTIWQYNTGVSLSGKSMLYDRLTGSLSNANLGNFLLKTSLPIMGIMAYHFVSNQQYKQLYLPTVGFAVTISLVAVSGERSTAVLALLALLVIGMTLFIFQPQIRKMVALGAVAMAALLGLLAATQPVIADKAQFFAEQVADFENTYYGQMYIASAKLFLEYPLTGVGAKQFLTACKPEVLNVTYCDIHPHNMYFEWLSSTGFPGIVLFIAAMAVIGLRLWRAALFKGPAIILTTFAFTQYAVMLFPFVVTQSVFSNWPALLFWYSLGLGVSLLNMVDKKHV